MVEKEKKLTPVIKQKYEYRVEDYNRPYDDFGGKEQLINRLASQGWELVCTSIIPMNIRDDIRVNKETGEKTNMGKKVWCIEHLYFRRELEEAK